MVGVEKLSVVQMRRIGSPSRHRRSVRCRRRCIDGSVILMKKKLVPRKDENL
jgi:hypothetical protein